MNPIILDLVKKYLETNSEEYLINLWDRFQPLVNSCIYKYYIPSRNMEDIRQESFLILLDCLKEYTLDKNVPFESFYKMTLSYFLLNKVQKKTEVLTVDNNWQDGTSLANFLESKNGNPEFETQRGELLNTLNKAFKNLTSKQYTCVILFYIYDYPICDIASYMNCTYSVVRKHKYAGLNKIKAFLELEYTSY